MFPDDTDDTFDRIVRDADVDARLARLSARADRSRPTGNASGRTAPKRRSAARGSRRTALGLSAVTTLGLAGWMYSAAGSTSTALSSIGSSADVTTTDPVVSPSTTAARTQSSSPTTTARSTTSTTTTTAKAMADGTYTGASSSTRWGPVQVQIVVSGGRIAKVNVLSYPSNDNKSVQINTRAVPTLVQSTLTAQSASVSSVSGATYTSASYKTSLQSAIDAARKVS